MTDDTPRDADSQKQALKRAFETEIAEQLGRDEITDEIAVLSGQIAAARKEGRHDEAQAMTDRRAALSRRLRELP